VTSPPDTSSQTGTVPAPREPAEPGCGPFLLRDVELSETLPALVSGVANRSLLLVRLFTEPLGLVAVPVPAGPAQIAGVVWEAFGDNVNQRVAAAGGDPLDALPPDGVRVPGTVPWLAQRAEVLAAAPPISVVLCTRDRADRLAPCLDRLRGQFYPDFEIVVVDNAPTTNAVRRLVTDMADPRVRYALEPRPGCPGPATPAWPPRGTASSPSSTTTKARTATGWPRSPAASPPPIVSGASAA